MAGASTSEEKKKKRKNPWELPPSSYNRTVFTLSNPFVSLRDLEAASVGVVTGDKIGDGKHMDEQTLDLAIKHITASSFAATMSCKQPTTEVGGRIVHGTLILDLYKVTKKRVVVPQITPEQLNDDPSGYEEGAAENLTDFCVATIEDEDEETPDISDISDAFSVDSNASVELRHEGDDPEDASGDEKTKYRFKILVQDQKIKGSDRSVTVLVVECSWETSSFNKLLHAAAYICRKDGIENMKKGRHEPIFVESWGKDNWRYGVFFLFGIVTLENGGIAKVASKLPKAAFNGMLAKSTKSLREYLNDPNAVYPDGDYIHGLLYTPRKDFKLPDMKTEGSGGLTDTDLFFESLIRIVCGNTALTWTPEDVMERMNARQNELNEKQARWRGKKSRKQ